MSISQQYSRLVEFANVGKKISAVGLAFLESLSNYALPEVLVTTGMEIHSESNEVVLIRAHGKILRSVSDHIWLTNKIDDKQKIVRLGGRIRFFEIDNEGKNVTSRFEIIFDHLGNARIGEGDYFGLTLNSGNAQDARETMRRIALGLITAIHEMMDLTQDT